MCVYEDDTRTEGFMSVSEEGVSLRLWCDRDSLSAGVHSPVIGVRQKRGLCD
ncbi:hypothetical protein HanPI659440_Chr06g0228121 [Helianthus annuus]|nr:hypothetical protein HanPI659440_Chr06g0228121 [Helianthus annuus]